MQVWELAGLVVALSLDGFFVGLSFGMRQIQVPRRSLVTLAACSGGGLGASMAAARLLNGLSWAGAGFSGWILLAVGAWRMLQAWGEAHDGEKGPLLALSLPQLGLMVQVLIDPAQADRDRSGRIDPAEAVVLGMALSLDAVAVGLAFAAASTPVLLPVWVGAGMYVLTHAGMALATRVESRWAQGRQRFLPGLILVLLGLVHLGRGGR